MITPIYVLNPKRKSYDFELGAIKEIIRKLRKHPQTKATITNLKIINLSDVRVDPLIVSARRRLAKQVGLLGYQYDYLGSIAKEMGTVGLGIEKPPVERDIGASATLRRFAHLKRSEFGFAIDESRSNPDVNLVFGHICFPILDVTEREMLDWARDYNYSDIMHLIWFCHSPIDGAPCGLCRPCEEKMGSNMGFLLPETAKKRYFKAQKWNFVGKKISRFIKNHQIRHLVRINDKNKGQQG